MSTRKFLISKTSPKIYFDYAATTPMDSEVEKAMNPFFGKIFGNPGSIHQFGQEASAAVFSARQKIAKAIGAKYDEIIFTGSATEANNLALRGFIKDSKLRITDYGLKTTKLNPPSVIRNPRIIVSAIEHESVLETARDLEKQGVEVVYIPVDKEGVVDIQKVKSALNERTILVSVMYANNEIGTIQPIAEIANCIRNFRNGNPESGIRGLKFPLFHTDAVQALQYLDCNVDRLGVDLMTLSAHKVYGPKGIGALYVTNKELGVRNKGPGIKSYKNPLIPMITGGGQESGLRSGTENVPYVVGFGKAVEINEKLKTRETKRMTMLRDYFWRELKKIFPKVQLNGSSVKRLSNNLNIYFPGSSAHDRCIELDLLGIAVSPGVACSARHSKPSYVIEALGLSPDRSSSSLRFSFGRQTTKKEMIRSLVSIRNLKSKT